jgi:hypothetical protein
MITTTRADEQTRPPIGGGSDRAELVLATPRGAGSPARHHRRQRSPVGPAWTALPDSGGDPLVRLHLGESRPVRGRRRVGPAAPGRGRSDIVAVRCRRGDRRRAGGDHREPDGSRTRRGFILGVAAGILCNLTAALIAVATSHGTGPTRPGPDRPAPLGDFTTQPFHLRLLLSGQPRPLTGVDLGTAHPLANRLRRRTDLLRDRTMAHSVACCGVAFATSRTAFARCAGLTLTPGMTPSPQGSGSPRMPGRLSGATPGLHPRLLCLRRSPVDRPTRRQEIRQVGRCPRTWRSPESEEVDIDRREVSEPWMTHTPRRRQKRTGLSSDRPGPRFQATTPARY